MRRRSPTSTHLSPAGEARMVDIGAKPATRRRAVAVGSLNLSVGALRLLRSGALKKGDALAAARIAGILAAKRVDSLIPLCHPLALECVEIRFGFGKGRVDVEGEARTSGRTGVEMEAMTAVCVACLTLYDMVKSEDRGMTLGPIYLKEKHGGRSGAYIR